MQAQYDTPKVIDAAGKTRDFRSQEAESLTGSGRREALDKAEAAANILIAATHCIGNVTLSELEFNLIRTFWKESRRKFN